MRMKQEDTEMYHFQCLGIVCSPIVNNQSFSAPREKIYMIETRKPICILKSKYIDRKTCQKYFINTCVYYIDISWPPPIQKPCMWYSSSVTDFDRYSTSQENAIFPFSHTSVLRSRQYVSVPTWGWQSRTSVVLTRGAPTSLWSFSQVTLSWSMFKGWTDTWGFCFSNF